MSPAASYGDDEADFVLRRLLPQTARHIILNMLWYENPLTRGEIDIWVRPRKSGGEGTDSRRCVPSLASLHLAYLSMLRNAIFSCSFHLHVALSVC